MFVFFGLRHFVRQHCALFSNEFHMNLQGFLRPELFFQRECCFFGLRHFVRQRCALFSYEFTRFLKTRIVFATRVFVFLVSETAPCLFSHEFTRFCKTRVVFPMRVFVFLV